MDNRILKITVLLFPIYLLSSFYVGSSNESRVPKQMNEAMGMTDFQRKENLSATKISWNHLRDLTFRPKYNKEYHQMISYPVFGESVKRLAGKQVSISGYMIPMDVNAGLYAISRFNYASCFFCGGAGLESVISLKFIGKPRRYKVDEYCTVQGTLELNSEDLDDFIYIFRDASEIKSY